jgi:hypothetical protein
MLSENAYTTPPQSGAVRYILAPAARAHVVSPSPSLEGTNVPGARKRGWNEEADPQSRPRG